MLNRLYIVVGVLAILLLGGAFVVPRLVNWNVYRDRLEALAEASLGTDVSIGGDIRFTLLPQPEITFSRTVIGPVNAPLAEIETVTARFLLTDFLRDRFTVTSLTLQGPQVRIQIDEEGNLAIPLRLADTVVASNVSVANARIAGGTLTFADQRVGQSWQLEKFDGNLRMSALRGPFSLQGKGQFGGVASGVRVSLSAFNAQLQSQVSVFWHPLDDGYSLSVQGVLDVQDTVSFKGKGSFRRRAPRGEDTEQIRGDLVVASDVELSAERLLLPAFEIQPDENQAGSRLSGALDIRLGAEQEFNAVISGGVVKLFPPDLTAHDGEAPYELATFLNALSLPPVPHLPGRIGVDVDELSLGSVKLRRLRLDATTDANSWQLQGLTADLGGGTRLRLTGSLKPGAHGVSYRGALDVQSSRLASLVSTWTRVGRTSPLHNMPGNITATIAFDNHVLDLSEGVFRVGAVEHSFAGRFDLSGEPEALMSVRLGAMDARQSAVLADMLPDLRGEGPFSRTFQRGSLDVAAPAAVVLGVPARVLSAQLDWDSQGVHVAALGVEDMGGLGLSVTGHAFGPVSAPILSGSGRLTLSGDAGEAVLPALVRQGWLSPDLLPLLSRSLPLGVNVKLDPPAEGGLQLVSLSGRTGEADLEADIQLTAGLGTALDAPLIMSASIHGADGDQLTRQFGLGERSLLAPGLPLDVSLQAQGVLGGDVETDIVLSSGDEFLGYNGTVSLADLREPSGHGVVDFALADLSPLLDLAGVGGLWVPPASGRTGLDFSGKVLAFSDMSLVDEEGEPNPFGGQFTLDLSADQGRVSGDMGGAETSLGQLVELVAGPAALLSGGQVWPDGPVDLGSERRRTTGRVHLRTPRLVIGAGASLSDASFDLVWDETGAGLENLAGRMGEGTVTGRAWLCCAGAEAQKQLTGRLTLSGVALDDLGLSEVTRFVSGQLDSGMQIEASGRSFADFARSAVGEGSFVLSDAVISGLDPLAFTKVAAAPDLSGMERDALVALIRQDLGGGAFAADKLSATFQIAGGTLRAGNVAVSGTGGQLLGNVRINLADLGLTGSWIVTPDSLEDPQGIVEQRTAQAEAVLGGTLLAPQVNMDVEAMADAIQMRLLEKELAELEALRAEQLERSRQQALARQRLMELDAQRAAEEAARLEAQKQREAQAAAQAAAEAAAHDGATASGAAGADSTQPLDLGGNLDPALLDPQPQDLTPPAQ